MLRELPAHRDLLWLLVVREIRVRYARAALGALWAVFPPLVMVLVFGALDFGRLIGDDSPYRGVPYVAFAFVGLLPWTHFATSLTQATPSLVLAAGILKKTRFPQEVVPLARVLAALLDLAIGLVLLVAILLWPREGGSIPLGAPVLVVPLLFALQLAFTMGLALLLSAANMFFRDVNYLLQVGIVLAMFATSVVYPVSVSTPWVDTVLHLNPMSSYLDAYREALLLARWPSLDTLLPGIVGAVLSITIGASVFRRCAPRFAEEC